MIKKIINIKDVPIEWDDYVTKSPNSTPFHLRAYSQSIYESYGYKQIFLIAYHESHIVGILPITIMTSLSGKKFLSTLPFCDVCCCIADNKKFEQQLLKRAMDILISLKLSYWELKNSETFSKLNTESLNETTKVRMVLPLPESTSLLWKQLTAKVRNQIRKAEKKQLDFEINTANSLDEFYSVYSRNMRDLGSPPHPLSWFRALQKNYNNELNFIAIKHQHNVIAAGVLLIIDDRAFVPWASSLREFNYLNSNMLLYWQMLSLATEHQCTTFDFGRSTFGENTYRFKKQWGAKPISLQWQIITPHGSTTINHSSTNTRIRTSLVKIWSLLPLPLATYLGGKLRKYISL